MGFRVSYNLAEKENVTFAHFLDVNKFNSNAVISNLEHFGYYLFWLQTITSHGLGPKSKAVKTRTLEKGERYSANYSYIKKEVRFLFPLP